MPREREAGPPRFPRGSLRGALSRAGREQPQAAIEAGDARRLRRPRSVRDVPSAVELAPLAGPRSPALRFPRSTERRAARRGLERPVTSAAIPRVSPRGAGRRPRRRAARRSRWSRVAASRALARIVALAAGRRSLVLAALVPRPSRPPAARARGRGARARAGSTLDGPSRARPSAAAGARHGADAPRCCSTRPSASRSSPRPGAIGSSRCSARRRAPSTSAPRSTPPRAAPSRRSSTAPSPSSATTRASRPSARTASPSLSRPGRARVAPRRARRARAPPASTASCSPTPAAPPLTLDGRQLCASAIARSTSTRRSSGSPSSSRRRSARRSRSTRARGSARAAPSWCSSRCCLRSAPRPVAGHRPAATLDRSRPARSAPHAGLAGARRRRTSSASPSTASSCSPSAPPSTAPPAPRTSPIARKPDALGAHERLTPAAPRGYTAAHRRGLTRRAGSALDPRRAADRRPSSRVPEAPWPSTSRSSSTRISPRSSRRTPTTRSRSAPSSRSTSPATAAASGTSTSRDRPLRRAGDQPADCTITIAAEDFQKLHENPQANGMQLFFAGKLKVAGNQMLAMKLQKLFSLGSDRRTRSSSDDGPLPFPFARSRSRSRRISRDRKVFENRGR